MYDHFNLCVILDCTTSSQHIMNSTSFLLLFPQPHTYVLAAELRAVDLVFRKDGVFLYI